MTGDWRKLRNEELHDVPFSPDIVRVRNEKGGPLGTCRVLVGAPEEGRQLGRSKRKWKNNIKTSIIPTGPGPLPKRVSTGYDVVLPLLISSILQLLKYFSMPFCIF